MRKKQGSLVYVNLDTNCATSRGVKNEQGRLGSSVESTLLNNQMYYNFFSISGSLHMLKFIALLSLSFP